MFGFRVGEGWLFVSYDEGLDALVPYVAVLVIVMRPSDVAVGVGGGRSASSSCRYIIPVGGARIGAALLWGVGFRAGIPLLRVDTLRVSGISICTFGSSSDTL